MSLSKNLVAAIEKGSILGPDSPADFEIPGWIKFVSTLIKRFSDDSAFRRRLILVLVASLSGTAIYRSYVAAKQNKLDANREKLEAAARAAGGSQKRRVAVDGVFFARLTKILHIVIPNIHSTEMAYLCILTSLLIARTWISIYIAEILGVNAQSLVTRKWGRMWKGVKAFALITIPASAINSGLKYFQEMISLRFRIRLSHYVHDEYLDGVNFYKACNLGGEDRIANADQRVTADIKDFSDEIAALYSSILKPVLDVILFTYKLGQILGWQGPFCMHAYFFIQGLIKKNIMPNLGRLVAKESELEGYYRTAHQRVITNSEEIAFYQGSAKEKTIINNALNSIYSHIAYARYVKAAIGVFDGLLVKYYASIAGYTTLLSPLLFNAAENASKASDELTRDYIRNSQYLGNLSTAVGQLVIVGNKLTAIAGYTSRVSELLEAVRHLNNAGNKPFVIREEEDKDKDQSHDNKQDKEIIMKRSASGGITDSMDNFIGIWKRRCDATTEKRIAIRESTLVPHPVVGGGEIRLGSIIGFEHVDIVSPEGKLLVKDLNFKVEPGVNVMVTGPNGVGKSSLFRIIGELWPLHSGIMTKPHNAEILFVPQKPYLVLGTLRDQLIYPHTQADMLALGVTDSDLAELLAIVDPAGNILREWNFDTVKDWFQAFSGGQKQRVAMARLFYHRPKFAILDECTSAVSDEVEGIIYNTCRKLGSTIFTVSHRPQLAQYHDKILRFEGKGLYTVKDVTKDMMEKGHL